MELYHVEQDLQKKMILHVKDKRQTIHRFQNMQVKGSTPVHCQMCPLGAVEKSGLTSALVYEKQDFREHVNEKARETQMASTVHTVLVSLSGSFDNQLHPAGIRSRFGRVFVTAPIARRTSCQARALQFGLLFTSCPSCE